MLSVVNFFISGNLYFSFVLTSLAIIKIPPPKKKNLPEIKYYLQHIHKLVYMFIIQ